MNMADIASYTEFKLRLDAAVAALKRYEQEYPDEWSLNGLRHQLEALDEWTQGGKAPTSKQKGRLNFGLLAIHNLAPLDRELANELHDLSSYTRNWRTNQ